jgi:hypothetical protein
LKRSLQNNKKNELDNSEIQKQRIFLQFLQFFYFFANLIIFSFENDIIEDKITVYLKWHYFGFYQKEKTE